MPSADVPTARGLGRARALILVAIFAGGGFLWLACEPGQAAATRVLASVGALLCLMLPALALYVGARRYYRTGRWTVPLEERAGWRQRYAQTGRRRMEPVWTALLVLIVLLNLVATAMRMHRHGWSLVDVLILAAWSVFLAAQLTQLQRQLRTRHREHSLS